MLLLFKCSAYIRYNEHIIKRKDCDIVNLVDKITEKQIRTDIPEFQVGDTVRVNIKIDEKDARGNIKTRL